MPRPTQGIPKKSRISGRQAQQCVGRKLETKRLRRFFSKPDPGGYLPDRREISPTSGFKPFDCPWAKIVKLMRRSKMVCWPAAVEPSSPKVGRSKKVKTSYLGSYKLFDWIMHGQPSYGLLYLVYLAIFGGIPIQSWIINIWFRGSLWTLKHHVSRSIKATAPLMRLFSQQTKLRC